MNGILIAWRNVFRNKRRTMMAMASIVVGVVALAMVSGFVATIRYSLYTNIVRAEGHVQVMAENHLDLGISNPGQYYLADWQEIATMLQDDETVGPMIRAIAPQLTIAGVASNAESGSSRSFVGTGYVPDLFAKMQEWDDFNLGLEETRLPLDAADADGVVVGVGLARQLQICNRVDGAACTDYPVRDRLEGEIDSEIASLSELASEEVATGQSVREGQASIDLMVAGASGAPNARSAWVGATQEQARRQADNSFVAMTLEMAQNLAYEDEDHVSQLMVQFHSSADAEVGLARIQALLSGRLAPVDVLPLETFNDTFTRVVAMFTVFQLFVGVVVGLIILFMIANTMAIVVLERVNEVGTLRALGESRGGILKLFLLEGVLLGALSATIGTVISALAVELVNNSGLTFTTPTSTTPIPIQILYLEAPSVVLGIWLMITIVATVSSILPAFRAAGLGVADALRHA